MLGEDWIDEEGKMQGKFWESSLRRGFSLLGTDGQRASGAGDTLRLKEHASALPLPPVLSLKVEGNHKHPPSVLPTAS